MSKEKLQAFAEAVSRSEELQKRFNSIQAEAAKSTAEKLAKLSESASTPFTAEEYLQSVAESSEQLSAEQLHAVAGGAWELTEGNIAFSIFTVGIGCLIMKAKSEIEKGDPGKCQVAPPWT
jgi:hypothetical protein